MFTRGLTLQAPHPAESFLTGTNNTYVEEMYRAWTQNPNRWVQNIDIDRVLKISSVHKSWDVYFRQVNAGASPEAAFTMPPMGATSVPTPSVAAAPIPTIQASPGEINEALALSNLIRAFQVHGHRAANLDPLGLASRHPPPDYREYGFSEAHMNKKISIPPNL